MNLKNIYLKVYRAIGFWLLVSLTATIFFYSALMVFFLVNASWISPTILSPTSDRMLQFSAGYQTAVQNYATLKALESQAEREAELARNNVRKLRDLNEKFLKYNGRTISLTALQERGLEDSYKLSNNLESFKKETEQSVKAGLITKADAAQLLAYIQVFRNGVIDGNLNLGTTRITASTQEFQLNQQLAQAESDEKTKEEAFEAAKTSLALATKTLATLERSSYRRALDKGANLAFLPYENINAVKPGAPVFDCYLLVAACRKVGEIEEIYEDEQVIEFPIFNVRFSRTVRGVLASMKMDNPASMSSSIFFAGRKPLFF